MPNLEKLIVLALLLYCLHTFSPMRAVTAVYNGSRLKLQTDLPRRVRRRGDVLSSSLSNSSSDVDVDAQNQNEEAVILWVYFNLADSFRAANDSLLPAGVQVMADLRTRFPNMTRSWETCEEVLKQFFWTERFLGRCARYWNESEIERIRGEMEMDRQDG